MAARKQKQRRMSAQVVEEEDYQLRYEIVTGIDVAKESAVVCVRMPPAEGRKHRMSHLQMVPAGRTCGASRVGNGHRAHSRSYTPGITGPPSRTLTRNVRPRVAR